jgi:hypothetical protein
LEIGGFSDWGLKDLGIGDWKIEGLRETKERFCP